jgi:hypothetical protein
MTDYACSRSRRGTARRLHRAECRTLVGRQVDGYATWDGLPPGRVRDLLADQGETAEDTAFCRICLPDVEPLPQWQPPLCGYMGCGKPMTDLVHVAEHCFIGQDQWRQHFAITTPDR